MPRPNPRNRNTSGGSRPPVQAATEDETLEDVLQDQGPGDDDDGPESEGGQQGDLQTALAEARERGRIATERAEQLESRLATAERDRIERSARLEQRLELINQRLEQSGQQQQQIQIPDVLDDPLTHFRMRSESLEAQNQQLLERLTALEQTAQGYQQQQQQEQTIRSVMSNVDAQQRAFASQNPDYYDAVNDLRARLDSQLQAAGYQHPIQRSQIIQQQFNTLMANAMQQGRNPAEAAYMWSKTAGYKPQNNRIQQLQQGQDNNRGMNGAPGRTPKQLNLETIANMDQKAFDALINDDRRFKALFN